MIDIQGLNVFYGATQILKNISLQINDNEILALIGPSGCGKSTLLFAINRLIEERGGYYSGDIYLNGQNIKEISDQKLRTSVGMVFQDAMPFPFSVYKNLSFALNYHSSASRKALELQSQSLLKLVGLSEEVSLKQNAAKLSGGQQQRLSIARALSVDPEVLLLDEPCSQLDVQNTYKIEHLLMELKNTKTIVIVTHNLPQAQRIADRVCFMYSGEVIEIGDKNQMFNQPGHQLTQKYVQGYIG